MPSKPNRRHAQPSPSVAQIVARLEALGDPANVAGMARYGIVAKRAFGVSAPALRAIAKEIGVDHELAGTLWDAEILETRALAALVDEPELVTEGQMERWVDDFDSWAVCDGCCIHLFRRTPFAHGKAVEWSGREEEFVKRAGFVMMATLAVHDKKAPNATFERYLKIIARAATDERNMVKKAVNWALRQIGKRNRALERKALATARAIAKIESRAARWIAADAIRELESPAVAARLSASTRT